MQRAIGFFEDDHREEEVDEDDNDNNDDLFLPVALPLDPRGAAAAAAAGGGPDHLLMLGAGELVPPRAVPLTSERVSPYLLHLIRENPPCNFILPGIAPGCQGVLERCQSNPEEVLYRCPETGRSVLAEATARCSCIHVIHAILEVNSDLTTILDYSYNTPLHLLFLGLNSRAVEAKDFDVIVDKLLQPQPGYIASVRNRDGNCALHFACEAPEEMVPFTALEKLLRAYGTGASRVNSRSRLPLHVHCSRRHASTRVAQLLLDAYPEGLRLLDQTDDSWTPLHYACASKPTNLQLAHLLAESDSSALRLRSRNGETALHVLCRQRPGESHLPTIRQFLTAAPDVATWKDVRLSQTPLHLLCRCRTVPPAVVQTFVRCSPGAAAVTDGNLYLPIHHACEVGADPSVVQCLIEAYPHGTKAQTRKKDTALSLACAANTSVETVRLLLKHNTQATATANDYGFIPLHCVARAYQPSPEITRLLLEANPESVTMLTNGDETAIHLASSNARTSLAVLQMLALTQENIPTTTQQALLIRKKLAPSTGNTPLHHACFRGGGVEQIEALALAHPDWISMRNNAGYSPLQILCKSGRIDDSLITLFARIGGPTIFQTVDSIGNTPLHSAMREETQVDSLLALIHAFPGALQMKTAYNDTPLHLACFRRMQPDVVREVALATCKGVDSTSLTSSHHLHGSSIAPLLTENTAGQSPIAIALEEFEKSFEGRSCLQTPLNSSQQRAFDVLVALAKIIHNGARTPEDSGDDAAQSLLEACVSLHRKNIRLDPAFILRAIALAPEEARRKDPDHNFPLHIEASIPIEKMPLLSGTSPCRCCQKDCHGRMGVLRALLDVFPDATKCRSASGDFTFGLMVQNGRPWDQAMAMVLSLHPQAFHWIQGITPSMVPRIVSRIIEGCGRDTLFTLIQTRPDFLSSNARLRGRNNTTALGSASES